MKPALIILAVAPLIQLVCIMLVLTGKPAYAYPSLARHGYTTCTTCHFSPSGGGLLTAYGKYIADELLGTFNDSSNALPWLVPPAEEQIFTANVFGRVAQTRFETENVVRGKFQKMRLDLEVGLAWRGMQAVAAAGPYLDAGERLGKEELDFFFRHYWAGYVGQDWALRVGHFFPEYGINHYNHNINTRKRLYFNHNEEPFIAQATWFQRWFDISLAGISGAEQTELSNKTGVSGTLAYKADGWGRLGVSGLKASDSSSSNGGSIGETSAFGTFAQVGYLRKGYTLVELDRKLTRNRRGHEETVDLFYGETGWELFKGFRIFGVIEYTAAERARLSSVDPQAGVQFHPLHSS